MTKIGKPTNLHLRNNLRGGDRSKAAPIPVEKLPQVAEAASVPKVGIVDKVKAIVKKRGKKGK
jgi:hypothetical protein